MAGKYGCTGTTSTGKPCDARVRKGTTLCSAHDGTLQSVARDGALARAASQRARKEEAAQAAAIASLSLDERLRIAAAKEGDALISQLIKLAKDGDRQAIALVFDRVEGRSVQRVVTEETQSSGELEKLSTDELRRMLRVVPGGAVHTVNPQKPMDKGIEPAI